MPRQPRAEDLRVGLISWAGSYLTYEPYKNTVTATAKGLGRRQVTEQTCTGTLFPGSQAVCLCLCVCTCGYIFNLITFLASAIVRASLAFAHRPPLLHLPVSKPVPRGEASALALLPGLALAAPHPLSQHRRVVLSPKGEEESPS